MMASDGGVELVSHPPVVPSAASGAVKSCKGCGGDLVATAKFCRNCGEPVASRPVQRSGSGSGSFQVEATPTPTQTSQPPKQRTNSLKAEAPRQSTDTVATTASAPAGPAPLTRPPSRAAPATPSASDSGRPPTSAATAAVAARRSLSTSPHATCSICRAAYSPPSAKFCHCCGHHRGGTVVAQHPTLRPGEEGLLPQTCACGKAFPKAAVFCVHCGAQRAPPATPPQPPSSAGGGGGGKTRQQLAEEAAARGEGSDDESGYRDVSTHQCTSLDLLHSFLQKKDTLEGWTKGPLIGRGSFGSVYQGLLTNGGFVAAKQVDISRSTGWEKGLKSLHRELSVMRLLDHPNVCKYLGADYNQEEDCLYIFMEYVTGGSLASLIKRFKLLPMQVVRGYSRDVFQGLAYLHQQGVIHRDIKGENVLVDQDKGMCKLADFGAAKKLIQQASEARTMIGTPYWMAPEVINRPEGYNEKADVWSAGCTIVEMLTGKPPWPTRATPQQAMMMIAQGTQPTDIPTDISDSCKAFLDLCFQVDIEKRAGAEQLLNHNWLCETE